MVVLFTDYGWQDPYVGQLKAVLYRDAPKVEVIDLLHDVPKFNAHAGAHLLAALKDAFPAGSVFLCVVDPGVGSDRYPVIVEADGRTYVGPDNGLLSVLAARATQLRVWRILWQPEALSNTFHGRDLFAPIAAQIAHGGLPENRIESAGQLQIQFDASDLPRVLYIDHFGNAWTGLRGNMLGCEETLIVKEFRLSYQRIFQEGRKSVPFWHVNSSGLVEIAANRDSAAALLELAIGERVQPAGSPDSRLH